MGNFKTILLFAIFSSVSCANIIVIETIGCFSHLKFMNSIVYSLLEEGHSITMLSPLHNNLIHENLTQVNSSSIFNTYNDLDINFLIEKYGDIHSILPITFKNPERDICDKFYEFKPVKDILATKNYYNLVILEPFYSTCLTYVGFKLNIPEIYIYPTILGNSKERQFTGIEGNPSYVPHLLFKDNLNGFINRIKNKYYYVYNTFVAYFNDFIDRQLHPKFYDFLSHSPYMVFLNSHFLVETTRPFSQNTKQIGGIHIENNKNVTIPQDILDFMDSAKDGVIFVSFGKTSNIKTLHDNITVKFLNVFRKLPSYKILFKHENNNITNIPDNVLIKPWFPQKEILDYKKTKLFLSHGGMLSVLEAISSETNILGIPLFYDQFRNIQQLKDRGFSVSIDLCKSTEEEIYYKIKCMLKEKSFAMKAKEFSKLLNQDIPYTKTTVKYWVKYVLDNKNSFYLKSHIALNLNWFEYLSLDIYLLLFIILYLLWFLVYKIFSCISSR